MLEIEKELRIILGREGKRYDLCSRNFFKVSEAKRTWHI